jgi:Tfp pilus assembly protein PilO
VGDNTGKLKFSNLEIYNCMWPVILKIIIIIIIIIVIIHLLNSIAM